MRSCARPFNPLPLPGGPWTNVLPEFPSRSTLNEHETISRVPRIPTREPPRCVRPRARRNEEQMTTPGTVPGPPGPRGAVAAAPDGARHGEGQQAHQRRKAWASVGSTAAAKIVVMAVAGVFGLVNTRLIISHFGADA